MRPFFRIYGDIIRHADRLVPGMMRPMWLSATGPRTVFFWGPAMKWCVVLAGLIDVLARPPHLISQKQSLVLALSGVLWSRWSLVIKPKNYSYLACNAVLSVSQCMLLWRSLNSEWKKWQDEKAHIEQPDYVEKRAGWPFRLFVD
ncbi:uncharacterized protein Dana_GF15117, isoform A [Drosophila ananassae]|uniref:Mitochondrial pyruvate carrier n=1 Tax=Drosophila ananassae TaxID=7217 RepID=B3MMT8_DROAN|nr:mitochondrial pyruvate carrier 2 isoform X1 [Drosophila ananassae]EDV30963.2 uncharacterized protein Dana_GF15117, isoform A [Drosophila ananassae]